jgi:hypothetical protein
MGGETAVSSHADDLQGVHPVVLAYTFFIVCQNTIIINNSSTSHVQMGLLEV